MIKIKLALSERSRPLLEREPAAAGNCTPGSEIEIERDRAQ